MASTFPFTSVTRICCIFFPRNRFVWIVGEGGVTENINSSIGLQGFFDVTLKCIFITNLKHMSQYMSGFFHLPE